MPVPPVMTGSPLYRTAGADNAPAAVQTRDFARLISSVVAVAVPPTVIVPLGLVTVSPPDPENTHGAHVPALPVPSVLQYAAVGSGTLAMVAVPLLVSGDHEPATPVELVYRPTLSGT